MVLMVSILTISQNVAMLKISLDEQIACQQGMCQMNKQQYRQMITILPHQYPPLSLSDNIQQSESKLPPVQIDLKSCSPLKGRVIFQDVKVTENKKRLSYSNILLGFTIISFILVAATAYIYWPQVKQESKIIDKTNTLIDVSRLQAKQTPQGAISHPNDGSTTSSAGSSNAHSSTRNDHPQRTSRPILKGEGSSPTIIGSGDPPGDDDGQEEDDDPSKKKGKALNKDNIYSDGESESEDNDDGEDDVLHWLVNESAGAPLVSSYRP